MKRHFLIISCSVWDVYFSCLFLESVHYSVEMCVMCALVLLGSFCVPFINSLIKFYVITMIINTKSVDIFSFFPVRFGMYISVAWFWNLYIIRWKCVWCMLLCCWGHFVFLLPIHWSSLFHHDSYRYQVCGYDTALFIGQQVLSVICVALANPLIKPYFIMILISYETTFSHYFLFGLRCIFQLPGSGICTL